MKRKSILVGAAARRPVEFAVSEADGTPTEGRVRVELIDEVRALGAGVVTVAGAYDVPLVGGVASAPLIAGTVARYRVTVPGGAPRVVTVPAGETPVAFVDLPDTEVED